MKTKFLIALCLFFTACHAQKPQVVQEIKTSDSKFIKLTIVTVLDKRDLDGCGFLLMKEDSSMLNPGNLADSLRISGLRLGIRFHEIRNMVTNCMSGKNVELDEVKKISK